MLDDLLHELHSLANPHNVQGMARFGISPQGTLGVPMPELRRMARGKRDHRLAGQLWDTGLHEARILAGLVEDPGQVDEEQMERWARGFNSWDVCDQACSNLFWRTPYAAAKALEWSSRPQEFVKRAGFVLMAVLAVHDKKAGDALFLSFLPAIQREAGDERNFVKKAVNWALRQIGKRNARLNQAAVECAAALQQQAARSARWIAADALRELTGPPVQEKLSRSKPP